MKNLVRFLMFFTIVVSSQTVVIHAMNSKLTLNSLPDDLLKQIISLVPEGANVEDRYKDVGIVTACCKQLYKRATDWYKDSQKKSTQKYSKLLLATNNISVEQKQNALLDALRNEHYELFMMLLNQNKDLISKYCNQKQDTLLTYYVTSCQLDIKIVKFLVEQGININAQSKNCVGPTPQYIDYQGAPEPPFFIRTTHDLHDGLNAMDILVLKLILTQFDESKTTANTIKQILNYLHQNGGHLSKKIKILDRCNMFGSTWNDTITHTSLPEILNLTHSNHTKWVQQLIQRLPTTSVSQNHWYKSSPAAYLFAALAACAALGYGAYRYFYSDKQDEESDEDEVEQETTIHDKQSSVPVT